MATEQIVQAFKAASVGDILVCQTSTAGNPPRIESLQVVKLTRSSVTLRDADGEQTGTLWLRFTDVNNQAVGYRVWSSVSPAVVH